MLGSRTAKLINILYAVDNWVRVGSLCRFCMSILSTSELDIKRLLYDCF